MNTILDPQYQSNIVDHANQAIRNWEDHITEPSAIYRPKIYIDGDQWCALYGDTLQSGVCGFGDSPYSAVCAFNKAWYEKLPKESK